MANDKVIAANKDFSNTFQKALSTITKGRWQSSYDPKRDQFKSYSWDSDELKTTDGKRRYYLEASMVTEVVDDLDNNEKRVHTLQYLYAIQDADRKPLYEFHWHPFKRDAKTSEPKQPEKFPYPHIHIESVDSRFDNLNKQHIPSGRVALEDVLRFLFLECRVKPERKDWQNILSETKKKFNATKSWGADPPPIQTLAREK
jgi:hypothetical protein